MVILGEKNSRVDRRKINPVGSGILALAGLVGIAENGSARLSGADALENIYTVQCIYSSI